MNPDTGDYVRADNPREAAALLNAMKALEKSHLHEDDIVMVQGSDEAVERLSRAVRLGAAEMERREKRRKQQKESRKRNR